MIRKMRMKQISIKIPIEINRELEILAMIYKETKSNLIRQSIYNFLYDIKEKEKTNEYIK